MTRIKLVRRGQNPLPKRSPIQNSRTSHCLVVVWMSIAFSVSVNPPIPLPDKVPRHWSVHFAGLDHSLPRTIHQAAHLISPLTQENLP